jgi:hypothetical protein
MATFTTSVAPLPEEVVATYRPRVPEPVAELWDTVGVARTDDGFVRVLDPARAEQMVAGVVPLPEGAVPVFSTGLGDLICWWPAQDLFAAWKFRWGVIDPVGRGGQAADLVERLGEDAFCDQVLERQPYPEAAALAGIPGPDQCYGFVPLLALGGPPTAEHLDLGGMWEHIALIHQLAGPARPRQRNQG